LSVFLDHGSAKAMLHFLGLASEHRGLIGHADRLQMNIRIEALRISAFKLFQEFGFIAALDDVITDVVRLSQGKHNQVMSTAASASLRAGRLGFLVPRFAVND